MLGVSSYDLSALARTVIACANANHSLACTRTICANYFLTKIMEEHPGAKRQKVNTAPSLLIDSSDFQRLGKELAEFDEKRETIIKKSRDVGKLAKNAIFSLHRSQFDVASSKLSRADDMAATLQAIVRDEPDLRHGSFSAAMEEYAEARIFEEFLKIGRLLPSSSIPQCNRDEYLGGCLDFTGELNRYAVAKATKREVEVVQSCKDLVEGIFGEFLQYDMRNGAIRKKFDSVKYTLKKLETLLYELSLSKVTMPSTIDALRKTWVKLDGKPKEPEME